MHKTCKNMRKSLNTTKIHPNIDPGGLRRPLASQLGAWSLPKLLPEPSGASKKFYDRARGCPGAPLEPFFIEKKPGYHGTGSARNGRASSIAGKARAARAGRTAREGAPEPHRGARREWREPPENRDSEPVRSLMP